MMVIWQAAFVKKLVLGGKHWKIIRLPFDKRSIHVNIYKDYEKLLPVLYLDSGQLGCCRLDRGKENGCIG